MIRHYTNVYKTAQKVLRFAAFFQVKTQKNKVKEDLVLANHKEVSDPEWGEIGGENCDTSKKANHFRGGVNYCFINY